MSLCGLYFGCGLKGDIIYGILELAIISGFIFWLYLIYLLLKYCIKKIKNKGEKQ